jgi:hypothetical protein
MEIGSNLQPIYQMTQKDVSTTRPIIPKTLHM